MNQQVPGSQLRRVSCRLCGGESVRTASASGEERWRCSDCGLEFAPDRDPYSGNYFAEQSPMPEPPAEAGDPWLGERRYECIRLAAIARDPWVRLKLLEMARELASQREKDFAYGSSLPSFVTDSPAESEKP